MMNNNIILNLLKIDIDFRSFDSIYTICRIKKNGDDNKIKKVIIDLDKKIFLNATRRTQEYIYILCQRKFENDLDRYFEEANILYELLNSEELNKIDFLYLTFFALQSSPGKGHTILNDSLYFVDDSCFKSKGKQILTQKLMLETFSNNNIVMYITTETYTSVDSLNEYQLKKCKDKKRNLITLNAPNNFSNFNVAQICEDTDTDLLFYKFQFDNRKSKSKDFLTYYVPKSKLGTISPIEKYKKSRQYLLYYFINKYNQYYKPFVTLGFHSIDHLNINLNTWNPPLKKTMSKNTFYKENLNYINQFLNFNSFSIVNLTDTKHLTNKLINSFLYHFPFINITVSESLVSESCNIVILHNKEFYTKMEREDQYTNFLDYLHYCIQKITVEELEEDDILSKAICEKILIECLVKNDLKNNQITLLPELYKKTNCENIIFGTYKEYKKDNIKFNLYHYIKIDINTLTMEFYTLNENELPYDEVFSHMLEYSVLMNNEKYIIENGKIYMKISDTNLFPMVNEEDLINFLKENKTNIRGKANGHLITNILDIKFFELNSQYGEKQLCYFSGIIGNGMDTKVAKAPKIRKIIGDEPEINFMKYFDFLNVSFITSNDRFTVYPFPFKYLSEYIRSYELLNDI